MSFINNGKLLLITLIITRNEFFNNSLFFCLTITTVLAQVVTTNIATPNSNGLSNNQVNDFDVTSDGTIS